MKRRSLKPPGQRRRCSLEALEARRLLAGDWRNSVNCLDVTGDGHVGLHDALAIVREIHQRGERDLPFRDSGGVDPYWDVDADARISYDDAVTVVRGIQSFGESPYRLSERDGLSVTSEVVIGLGQVTGSRVYRFGIEANFDESDTESVLEDILVVYLADADDSQTLLDRGTPGTSLFAMSGTQVDLIPEIVSFDGEVVEIDVSSLGDLKQGRLVFQLLNCDGDTGTEVVIRPLSNEVDPQGSSAPLPELQSEYGDRQVPLDFETAVSAVDLDAMVVNVRYDSGTGEYRADVQLQNHGPARHELVALEFVGLPVEVSLRDATGVTPRGNPYIAFSEALTCGLSGEGGFSDPLEVVLDVTGDAAFRWELEIWTGAVDVDGLESEPHASSPVEHFDIAVPFGDAHFDPFFQGNRTIPLKRTGYDLTTGTAIDNPRQHPNRVTSFIDGSTVYGSDLVRAFALRRNDGSGKLKTSAGNLLPLNDAATFTTGTLDNENPTPRDPTTLFAAGDVRANENPALASLHTLFVREHNRRVDELALADPTLSGEVLYQQARAWVGALLQHITYNEFLPLLLGDGAIGPYAGYDPSVNPSISTMFSGAAFRFGHSLAIPHMELLDASGDSVVGSPLSLREMFFNPDPLKSHGVEPVLRGMASQLVGTLDAQVIDDLRNFLFGPPGAGGLDLVSLNIQRGRDLGLPSYNDARRGLGLPAIVSFAEISGDSDVVTRLAAVYPSVEEIDLWVGGLAEEPVAGALVGPTFSAIIRDQFERLRAGDRFWYENGQFTAADLAAIRATTLQTMILQNTSITTLAANVFTTQTAPDALAPGGTAATTAATRYRTYDGHCNHETNTSLGQAGANLLQNYDVAYGDGVSTPAGASRPNPRAISNAVFTQTAAHENSVGLTHMFMIWGQLLTHDTNFSPGGEEPEGAPPAHPPAAGEAPAVGLPTQAVDTLLAAWNDAAGENSILSVQPSAIGHATLPAALPQVAATCDDGHQGWVADEALAEVGRSSVAFAPSTGSPAKMLPVAEDDEDLFTLLSDQGPKTTIV